jgi:hypothetical protein
MMVVFQRVIAFDWMLLGENGFEMKDYQNGVVNQRLCDNLTVGNIDVKWRI